MLNYKLYVFKGNKLLSCFLKCVRKYSFPRYVTNRKHYIVDLIKIDFKFTNVRKQISMALVMNYTYS